MLLLSLRLFKVIIDSVDNTLIIMWPQIQIAIPFYVAVALTSSCRLMKVEQVNSELVKDPGKYNSHLKGRQQKFKNQSYQ